MRSCPQCGAPLPARGTVVECRFCGAEEALKKGPSPVPLPRSRAPLPPPSRLPASSAPALLPASLPSPPAASLAPPPGPFSRPEMLRAQRRRSDATRAARDSLGLGPAPMWVHASADTEESMRWEARRLDEHGAPTGPIVRLSP